MFRTHNKVLDRGQLRWVVRCVADCVLWACGLKAGIHFGDAKAALSGLWPYGMHRQTGIAQGRLAPPEKLYGHRERQGLKAFGWYPVFGSATYQAARRRPHILVVLPSQDSQHAEAQREQQQCRRARQRCQQPGQDAGGEGLAIDLAASEG